MKVFAILFLLCGSVLANDRSYIFGDTIIFFTTVEGFKVNKACAEKTCEAVTLAKKYRDVPVPSEILTGGKNPSAARCKHFMAGTVIIGVDKEGNEQSFCKLPDGSYLNNSSI